MATQGGLCGQWLPLPLLVSCPRVIAFLVSPTPILSKLVCLLPTTGEGIELMKIRDEDFELSFGLWMIVIDPQLMLMTTCKSRSYVHAQLFGAP